MKSLGFSGLKLMIGLSFLSSKFFRDLVVSRILFLKIIQGAKSPNDKLVLINGHAITSIETAMTLAHFCNNDEMRYVNGADKVQEFYMKVLAD